ncbi:MAG: ABC transporter permease [Alphaproteobacteria bacterium]|nr:ABC transporter permease [Alphaproteobacteria bacterium]
MLRQLLISVLILLMLSVCIFWILGRYSSIGYGGYGGFSSYIAWLGKIVSGELGISRLYQQSVSDLLWLRLQATMVLLAIILLLIVPFALLLGALAGARPDSWFGKMICFFVMLFSCMPEFTIAIFCILIFSYHFGILSPNSEIVSGFQPLILPIIVLFLYGVSHLTRILRQSVMQVMHTPYIRTAVMKGLPFHHIVIRHGLRNAMMPAVKQFIVLMPWLLSAVIVTEFFFDYQGLGALLVEAALFDDVDVLQACILLSVLIMVLMQLSADLYYKRLQARMIVKKID